MEWRDKARLRPRELAEVASVSIATVRRKLASGEIGSYVEDGCRFVPIEAALAFVREDPAALPAALDRRALAMVERIRREVG